MGKTTKREGREALQEWRRAYDLHRECVRRNPDYSVAYGKLQTIKDPEERVARAVLLSEQWGLSPNDDLPNPCDRPDLESVKQEKDIPRAERLARTAWVDPIDFDALIDFDLHLLKGLDFLSTRVKGYLFLLYFPEEPGPPWAKRPIDMRQSKKRIQKAVVGLLDEALADRKRHGLTQLQPSVRVRLEKSFDALRVYDMKEQRKRYDEIEAALWPGRDGGTSPGAGGAPPGAGRRRPDGGGATSRGPCRRRRSACRPRS